jgi:hypothetical protein
MLDRRPLHAAFNDTGSNSVAGESSGIVDVKFLHQALPVFLNRFDADVQFVGGLLIGFALGNKLQHLSFPRGQQEGISAGVISPGRGIPVMTLDASGDRGAEVRPALIHFTDGLGQHMGRRLFDQIAGRAERHDLFYIRVIAMGGEHEDFGGRCGLQNLPRRRQPIEQRHGNIHDHHIRPKLAGQ